MNNSTLMFAWLNFMTLLTVFSMHIMKFIELQLMSWNFEFFLGPAEN